MRVTNFHLISDYSKRGAAVDQFERVVQIFRAASKEVGQMLFNNRYFCKWMSELLIAGWAGFGGFKVIAGELSLGLFLCDIQIFQTVEEISNRIFDIFVKLQTIGPSMERVVELLNLPTDLHERKQLQDNLRETTGYMRERVQKRRPEDVRMDLLPITLNNLSVTYTQASRSVLPPGQNAGWTTQKKIGCHGKLVIEQGTLVMLVGQLNCGKATRLRALGGAVLPNHVESLFIPSHLRVLHVDSQPVFFADTLFNNLTFGVTEGNPDGSQERVLKICEMLEVPKAVMDMITSGHVLEWDSACSNSEKQWPS
ncbi:unnamed protein product [Effrenium voratum]|nr:unnamed protein product [Effrenium voratum]